MREERRRSCIGFAVCGLRLCPKFRVRSAAETNACLRLAVDKIGSFVAFTKNYLWLHRWSGTNLTAAAKHTNQVKCQKIYFLIILIKVFLNNSPENWNLQSHNLYVMNLKGHLFNNVEGYPCKNSFFVDAERQYHTKVYDIISSALVWVAPKILLTNVVNDLH